MLNLTGIFDARRTELAQPPGTEFDWELDPTLVPAGCSLTENNTRLTNVSGGDDFRYTVPTIRLLTDGGTIPPISDFIYYEVHLIQNYTGPFRSYNGYVGWGSEYDVVDRRANFAVELPQLVSTGSWGLGWRGNGDLWGYIRIGEFPELTYGDRDPPKIARIIQRPNSQRHWFATDGDFVDIDGNSTGSDPITNIQADNYTAYQVPTRGWIGLNARDQGDSMKLVSKESEFLYPVPTNCVPLATIRGYFPNELQ